MQIDTGIRFRIDCRAVSYTPGFTDILSHVTFSAWPGECIGLLGPSGAGKSTLLKNLAGILRPTEGEVLYDGKPLSEVWERIKRLIGFVPQDDLVHPSLTPEAELLFAAALRLGDTLDEREIERKVDRLITLVGLQERRHTKTGRLSGGQRKRVSMAVELLSEPPVLFLDEPTSGLDPALEARMMKLFRKLASQGRTVVLTTHIMDSLDALDLVILLHRGRLVYCGPPSEAASFFGAKSFPDIYVRLDRKSAAEWESRFRASPYHDEYVKARFASGPDRDQLWRAFTAHEDRATGTPDGTEAPADGEGRHNQERVT